MRYISPFQELGIDLDGHLEKSDLNLAKKRLLAELDLSSKTTILKGSVELSKNDIINQFDKLAEIKNWDFHRLVLKDKALLDFVQNRHWDTKSKLEGTPQYNDPKFVNFISPYFSETYKSLIIKDLSEGKTTHLKSVLNITPRLLTDDDHENVWLSVESFLIGWRDSLDEMGENIKAGKLYDDKELAPYHGKSFMECLNLLPEEFSWFRDDYATSLFNISAYSWNKDKHYRAVFLVKNARLLDISEETATMLDERIAWFEAELARINTSDKTENWNIGTIARVIFFAIFFIVRLATCDNYKTPTPSYKFDVPQVDYPMMLPPKEGDTTIHGVDDKKVDRIGKGVEMNVQPLLQEILKPSDNEEIVWDKAKFDRIVNMIKKTDRNDMKMLFVNGLVIDKSLRQLQKLHDGPAEDRGMTIGEVDKLIDEFKALKSDNVKQ
jgi:hypothetical protein